MNVKILPQVLDYLDKLVYILYQKQYFSYLETSLLYVDKLLQDIENDLPAKSHKPAPGYYDKYGKGLYYATFVKNKRTHWYAFFSKYVENGETFYVVCYVGYNHTEAHHLYEGF
jgi:hypothetical protein